MGIYFSKSRHTRTKMHTQTNTRVHRGGSGVSGSGDTPGGGPGFRISLTSYSQGVSGVFSNENPGNHLLPGSKWGVFL